MFRSLARKFIAESGRHSFVAAVLRVSAIIFLAGCLPANQEFRGGRNPPDKAVEEQYYPFAVDEDNLTGLLDFSFLNRPLTAEDKIFVCGNHFCKVGPDLKPSTKDDQQVRFFGVNFANLANFPDAHDAGRISKRLRKLGVNLVRLHYIDRFLSSDTRDVRGILMDAPYPTLNPVAVARLRSLISALSAEGIYVDLNLHVAYEFRPRIDNVPSASIPENSKPLNHFFPAMVEKNEDYARKLIAALNLKNDPALALVEISNESSLVYSWLLASRNPGTWAMNKVISGQYADELANLWENFSGKRSMPTGVAMTQDGINFLNFLSGLDRKYFERMKSAVVEEAGDIVPVTGTQMLYGSLVGLDSQANLDFIDNHFYYDFYQARGSAGLNSDWRIRNVSLLERNGMISISNLAFFRDGGKPYTVSEFNQPWPNTNAAEVVPVMSALASLQDWDAIMFYQYRDDHDWDRRGMRWFNLSGDAEKLAGFGQAALMYRSSGIQVARNTYDFALSKSFRDSSVLSGNEPQELSKSFAQRFGSSRLLPLTHKVEVHRALQDSVSQKAGGETNQEAVSDSSELRYLPNDRLFTIQARNAVGAFGFVSPYSTIDLRKFRVKNNVDSENHIALLITCRAGAPIDSCHNFLVSNPGASVGLDDQGDRRRLQLLQAYPGARENGFTFAAGGREFSAAPSRPIRSIGPPFMKRQNFSLSFEPGASEIDVFSLDSAGRRLCAMPVERASPGAARIQIELGGKRSNSPWYEIELVAYNKPPSVRGTGIPKCEGNPKGRNG